MRLTITDDIRATLAWLGRDTRLAGLLAVLHPAALASVQLADKMPPTQVARDFWTNSLWGFVVFAAMLLCISLGHRALARHGAPRWAGLVVLCLLAGGIGFSLKVIGLSGGEPFARVWVRESGLASTLQLSTALAALLVALREFTQRSQRAADALHAAATRQLALQSEMAQAQSLLLQAQVEPHFLFNSLANVRRLLRTDAQAARLLLDDLSRYFGEALPRLRDERTTLGQEADLVRAFLAVYQVRMADRLRAAVDVPSELAACDVPPMALLALVENALKHGLQRLVEGGTIQVSARAAGGLLTLTVADTGRGMGSGSGHGTGLANLRARLHALHGAAANLSLRHNEPHGVVATVTVPVAVR